MEETDQGLSRWRAAIAIVPFLLLGMLSVVFLIQWGLDPLWGILVVPPILFVTTLGWIAFRSGLA